MNIVLWIIFGGIVGWIASQIMDTDAEQGYFMNIVIGIVGSVLGGLLMSTFGISGVTGFDIPSFAVSIIGSIILIWLVKLIRA